MVEHMPPQHVQAYKDACDNLIYLKKEQFQVTYYTWLLLAALYVLSRDFGCCGKLLLSGGALVVGILSFAVLRHFQAGIERFRKRLDFIYDKYFRAKEEGEDEGLGLDAATRHRTVVRVLYAACFAASIFTLLAIYLSPVRHGNTELPPCFTWPPASFTLPSCFK